MDYEYTFTIFTCTFNRAFTLDRVYSSLKSQTFRDFEWFVVDNGSKDNTKELIEKLKLEADFPIRFTSWKENTGVHRAFNLGVSKAKGKFFTQFDSDDACIPEALEILKKTWDEIPDESKEKFAGVTCLCVDQNGNIVGDKFPQDIFDSDSQEINIKYKIKGEKWGCDRTDVLKLYPFPDLKNGAHVLPSTIWYKIARKYKTRFINQSLRIYFIDEDGRDDQLSIRAHPKKNALARALKHEVVLNEAMSRFWDWPVFFFQSALQYSRYSYHAGTGFGVQIKRLNNFFPRFLWLITLPFATILYKLDNTRFYPVIDRVTNKISRKIGGLIQR